MLEDDSTTPIMDLRRALHALAAAGSDQPPLFPDERRTALDLARDFDTHASIAVEVLGGLLSASQVESLTALEHKLATMSRDGAEFDADLWTDSALRTSEHWADVRRLAQAALAAFA